MGRQIVAPPTSESDVAGGPHRYSARTTAPQGAAQDSTDAGPRLSVIILLFGGGLVFGLLQSLGYFPIAGLRDFTFDHYRDVLTDRNFLLSLWTTFRIAMTVTVAATVIAVGVSLILRDSSAAVDLRPSSSRSRCQSPTWSPQVASSSCSPRVDSSLGWP